MKKILLSLVLFFIGFLMYESALIYGELDSRANLTGGLKILDRNHALLAEIPGRNGYSEAYTGSLDIPLVQSLIEIEDKRYWTHHGTDMRAKISSLYQNIKNGKIVRGGSTITEQYIKNTYFPDASRDIEQKIREALWAGIAEIKYSKEEILRKYLDSVYMGNGIYGVKKACESYFSKDVSHLDTDEIIEIITRIHSPNLTPGNTGYQKIVTKILSGKDDITPFPDRDRHTGTNMFPLFTSRIQRELSLFCRGQENTLNHFTRDAPSRELCSPGYSTLITSLDRDLMRYANDSLEGVLSPLIGKNVHNGAIFIMTPGEQKVLAYIGNRGGENRGNAIDMIKERRSVGSILKPFVYLMSLDSGADGSSLILDDTRIYETDHDGKSFVPENYTAKSYGPIPLREALGNSLNSAAVRLTEALGIGKIYENFRKVGMDLDHDSGYYGYGIVLGGVELTLENIVEVYTSLSDTTDPSRFLLFDILSRGENRARTFGVSSILSTSIPIAVKTGTSTDFHDNWVLGYHEDAVIGVWVGNTDHSGMDDVSGVTGAGPIFHRVAEYMITRGMIRDYERAPPLGISQINTCIDRPCQKKILEYRRSDSKERESRIGDHIFIRSDFITPMTDEERKKWKIQ